MQINIFYIGLTSTGFLPREKKFDTNRMALLQNMKSNSVCNSSLQMFADPSAMFGESGHAGHLEVVPDPQPCSHWQWR